MNDRMHAIYRAFGEAVEQAGKFHQQPEDQPMTTGADIIAAITLLSRYGFDAIDHAEYVRLLGVDDRGETRARYERALRVIAGGHAGDAREIAMRALRPEEET